MEQKAPDMKAIMADYDKAVPFLSQVPAEAWQKMGEENSLRVFKSALENISAYSKFLDSEKFDPKSINAFGDFGQIPLMDKDNYYKIYSFNEINTVKAGDNLYSFALSSGTTDIPALWPRYFQAEESAHVMFGLMMKLYWEIDKKKTLFINASNLGVYASGIYINAAVKPLTQKYKMTLATTGSELENIVHTVKQLAKYYDQTVFVTYPTFMRTILDKLVEAGINLKDLNLKIFMGGEGHTVEWRRFMNNEISGNPENLTSIIDGYTVTETSLAGIGTPLCNLIRHLAADNPALNEKLFGQSEITPTLSQFNPKAVLIESVGNEIVMTSDTNTPLVRYNIHDRGGVIGFREMEQVLKEFGIDYKAELTKRNVPLETIWQHPFVYIFGRRTDTVIIGGGNIFPEQIEPVLVGSDRQEVHSFKFKMIADDQQHQIMNVMLELKNHFKFSSEKIAELEKEYHDIIHDRLMEVNQDYAIAYRSDPVYCDPVIKIYEFGNGPFAEDLTRTKPRLVIK